MAALINRHKKHGTLVSFVVKRDIYFSDDLRATNEIKDGIVFIAMSPDVAASVAVIEVVLWREISRELVTGGSGAGQGLATQ